MAKRQRGARPGQRPPLERGGRAATPAPSRPAETPRPATGLSADELARAAELEAAIVAEEQAAASAVARGRRDARRLSSTGAPAPRTRAAGGLSAIAADEYRWVTRDLRKIAAVFGLIFGLLVASWLAIVVTGLVEI
jgi:hypothetical protein